MLPVYRRANVRAHERRWSLIQIVVKQIHVKDERKVEGIELALDPTVQKLFFELAPFAKAAEGAFAFRKKNPSPGTVSFCDSKKHAEARLR
ncbi:hypothetical protein [Paenibacillus rhizophilus]|uniref:Uncharacterized protein n=1 Tax=Paenibacillus rhizophilus TaxID=1850366 RepID=A0A3N9NVT1_9BACL|nr:hypothetical protein [Paenibacillus rhizophilus]RQW07895.1 hypothetical protein EH198_23820 [Paenibacillus rhizophilus]